MMHLSTGERGALPAPVQAETAGAKIRPARHGDVISSGDGAVTSIDKCRESGPGA